MDETLADAIGHLRRGEWERAHAVVQRDESPLGSWAHGIVHLLEGDDGNARYWYGRAGRAYPDTRDVDAEVEALARAWEERQR